MWLALPLPVEYELGGGSYPVIPEVYVPLQYMAVAPLAEEVQVILAFL